MSSNNSYVDIRIPIRPLPESNLFLLPLVLHVTAAAATPFAQAVADLFILGFFFLLRPGKHTYSSTSSDSQPFTLADVTFPSGGFLLSAITGDLALIRTSLATNSLDTPAVNTPLPAPSLPLFDGAFISATSMHLAIPLYALSSARLSPACASHLTFLRQRFAMPPQFCFRPPVFRLKISLPGHCGPVAQWPSSALELMIIFLN